MWADAQAYGLHRNKRSGVGKQHQHHILAPCLIDDYGCVCCAVLIWAAEQSTADTAMASLHSYQAKSADLHEQLEQAVSIALAKRCNTAPFAMAIT